MSMYSPASVLDTTLAGAGGSQAPMVIQSSWAGRGGVVTEVDWPRILNPWTEPAGGRLPSAMKTGNTEIWKCMVAVHMVPVFMAINMQLKQGGNACAEGKISSLCSMCDY